MTLGGTISSVMIRIKGDSSDAVKALDNVQDEAKKTEKALDEAASGGDKMGTAMGVAWALLGGFLIYSVLKITLGLKLSPEEEYDGADLSVHKISATPDREVSW